MRISREKEKLLITSTSDINERLPANDIISYSASLFFFFSPVRSQDANRSFQIELETLDIRSNSAHEDEWAANCGLSRMSRGSSPAIFHSRLCTLHCKSLSLSLSLSSRSTPLFISRIPQPSLFLSFTLVAVQLSVSRLYRRSRFCRWCNKRERARPHPSCEPLCHSGINSA